MRILKYAMVVVLVCALGAFAGTINTKQVSVDNTATEVSTGSLQRQAVTIKNHDGSGAIVYCGPPTVTTGNGFELGAGQAITFQLSDGRTIDNSQAIECIAASGTQTVSVAEHLK